MRLTEATTGTQEKEVTEMQKKKSCIEQKKENTEL
jgi:hypothetical protein